MTKLTFHLSAFYLGYCIDNMLAVVADNYIETLTGVFTVIKSEITAEDLDNPATYDKVMTVYTNKQQLLQLYTQLGEQKENEASEINDGMKAAILADLNILKDDADPDVAQDALELLQEFAARKEQVRQRNLQRSRKGLERAINS